MNSGDDKAAARARTCAESIRKDPEVRKILREIPSRFSMSGDELDNIAGTVAGLHFVLPLEAAKSRYDRQRKMERAINRFRSEVETYQRRSGEHLPSPSTTIYNAFITNGGLPEQVVREWPEFEIEHYLAALLDHLGDAEGGTWVLPQLATATGRWPSTANSAAVIWIIRTLDSAGVPRVATADKNRFLCLATRLADLVQQSKPACDISPIRKDFENHPEFIGAGKQQWRR